MTATAPQPVFAILGATGGVGGELAVRLAGDGAALGITGRNETVLADLAARTSAHAEPLDADDWAGVERFVADVATRFGRLDGVAHCVGSLLLKPAHLTRREEWDEVMRVNLASAFGALRAAVKSMQDGGSVVLVSSAAARRGMPNHEAIAAAKAGVIGLTLSAAATYAPRGIRVNCVAPGLTQTPMTEKLTSSPLSLKASLAMHPLGRLGEPADVAGAIAWLLDPQQKWVTGQVIGVDGGLATLSVRPTG
jgi:NAD(P)-dependent dehydrogenase (short-subunit alcohol dehydrogenase family)